MKDKYGNDTIENGEILSGWSECISELYERIYNQQQTNAERDQRF